MAGLVPAVGTGRPLPPGAQAADAAPDGRALPPGAVPIGGDAASPAPPPGAQQNQQQATAPDGRPLPPGAQAVNPHPAAQQQPTHTAAIKPVQRTDVEPSIRAAVEAAAKKYHIDPALLYAIGEQETGLGKSSVYDPVNGISRTKGNQGHGIWQLDPASGASKEDLERASHDVFFAADRAAQMLSGNLQQHGGDLTKAVASYNAGSPTPQGMDYAKSVMGHMFGFVKSVGTHVYEAANKFYVDAVDRVKQSAEDAFGAAVNLEQTPARFIDTLIAHGVSAHSFSQAFHNALTPGEGDEGFDTVTRHVKQFIMAHDPTIKGSEYDKIVDAMERGTIGKLNPQWAEKVIGIQNGVRDFAHTFIAQTIADPVSWLPVVGWLSKIAGTAKVMDAMGAATRAVGGTKAAKPFVNAGKALQDAHAKTLKPVVDRMATVIQQRPELNAKLESHAKGAKVGFEQAQRSAVRHELEHSDSLMLEANKKGLKDVKRTTKGYALPDDIRQRYLQEAWRYGTPEMRTDAEALGYKPVPADAKWAKAPEGLLDYKLREDYQFLGKMDADLAQSPAFKKYGARGTGDTATFEHQREARYAGIDANQYERVKARLQMGRTAIWQRRADNDIASYIAAHGGAKGIDLSKPKIGPGGMTPAAAKADWEAKQIAFNKFINELGHEPVRIDSPLRIFGKLGTQAVQGTILPHAVNNVGTLAFLASPLGLARGVGYIAKGVSEERVARLIKMGTEAEYTTDQDNIWSRLPISKELLEVGQATLSKWEMAYRSGLLDELDRTLGPSVDKAGNVTDLRLEMTKGQKIRDALVDYRNIPLVIAWMEAGGAPFAGFFGGLTRALSKAVVQHPERVAAMQRGEQDVQQQSGITVPNPVATFDRLVFNPAKTVLQHGGPIGGAVLGALSKFIDPLASTVAENVERWAGPWLSQLPDFFSLPYTPKGTDPGTPSPLEGLLHALFGLYPYTAPSEYNKRQIDRSATKAGG